MHPSPQQLRINPSDIEVCRCARCNSPFFQMAFSMGKIKGLLIGSPEDQFTPIGEIIMCTRCGWELGRPLEPQATTGDVIVDEDVSIKNDDPTDNKVTVSEDKVDPNFSDLILSDSFKKKE